MIYYKFKLTGLNQASLLYNWNRAKLSPGCQQPFQTCSVRHHHRDRSIHYDLYGHHQTNPNTHTIVDTVKVTHPKKLMLR